MDTINSMRFVLTQSVLDDLCKKYYIPDVVHPQLPGRNDRIENSLADVLAYFRINLSQLSVIAVGKFSHFKILCRIYGFEPTVGNFRREGEVPLLELSKGRVISLAEVNDQGGVVAQGVGNDNVNEGRGGAATADQTEQSDPIVQIGGIYIEVDVEAQVLVADKPKKFRKKKTDDGVGGSGHPPKRLREDHDTSGDAIASTDGKSLAALQDLFDKSTLAAKIGVTTIATVPFHLFCDPTPEHEGGEYTDFVFAVNLRTNRPTKRFVISKNTPHDSNANSADDEVSSVVRSTVSDPVVLTTAIDTTVVAGTSVPQPREVNEPTHASIFSYSTSASNVGPDVSGPSRPAGNDISSESFYVSLNMDSETLHQIYVLKWDVLNESVLDDSNACRSLVDQLAPPVFFSQLCAMKYDQLFIEFIVGAARQTCIGAEVRMRLEHVLKGKRERNAALEFAAVAKDFEIAKLTQDLSSLQLSCDDLSIKASTLESKKDKLVDQNPPYKFKCTEKTVPVAEGSSETTTERSQQTTRNRGKAIVNSSAPIYDQGPTTVTEDDEMSKDNEIDKLVALISLSFKKIYKPTNNNLLTSSNTSRANQDNSPRINRRTGYGNPRVVNVVGERETVEYPEQPESVNEPYPDMCYDREQDDHDDTDELAQERDLLASLIKKLKCKIDDIKNRNKILETSNKALVDKLKGEIEDFKTKIKSLESSNNHFKEANNELSKTNQLMFKDLKKFQTELDRYHDANYTSKVAIDCAKAKGDLISYKMESEKPSN
nr:hypothetical protein [Tanacetum cinerariifolium]